MTLKIVELENKMGDTLTDKNFLDKDLNNEDSWTSFKKLWHDIMKNRQKREIKMDVANKTKKKTANRQRTYSDKG
jgi:hypothetical protein